MKRAIVMFFVAVVLSASNISFAQVAVGTPPYATIDAEGVDSINVGNLNVHLTIPVRHKAGRGTNFNFDLTYDSSVWYPASTSGGLAWQPVASLASVPPGWTGLNSAGGYSGYSLAYSQPYCYGGYQGQTKYYFSMWTYSNFFYVDPNGVKHSFSVGYAYIQGNGNCGPSSGIQGATTTAAANDGSGYTMTIVPVSGGVNVTSIALSYQVHNPGPTINIAAPIIVNGGAPYAAASQIDSNGNEITTLNGVVTDTLGQTALTAAGVAPSNTTFTYKTPSGVSETYTVKYTSQTVQTKFGCTVANGGALVADWGPLAQNLVSEIDLPDGSNYKFSYEATPNVSGNVTGRLASVTLPTGGVITYAYTGNNNGIICADGSAAGLTRSINADSGSSSATRTYTRAFTNGTPATSHTEVKDSASNYLEYDFVLASTGGTGAASNFYEVNRDVYNGPKIGTAVIARLTKYNGYTGTSLSAAITLPINEIDTYETLDGLQTHGSTVYYASSGAQTDSRVYDFGIGATRSTTVLSEETWGSGTNTMTDTVYTGGSITGETVYTYDGTTPTPTSNVPQHITNYALPRGNVTSTTVYASSGTSYTTNTQYYDTGLPSTVAGPTGTTTYNYDSTYTYLTSVSLPTPSSGVAISSSSTYDTTNTGLALTATDPNGQQTTYTYADPFLRPTLVQNPDGSNKTTYSYSATQTGQQTYQSSVVYGDTETQYDGYGRPSRVAVANGQNGNSWYQADTCYFATSNTQFTSYPYQAAGFSASKQCSGSGDTTTYDVLGRVKSIVRQNRETISYTYLGRATKMVDQSVANPVTRISQVDGLGRTSIVCEISSNSSLPGSGSPVSCGADIAGTGFVTSYAYTGTPSTTISQGGNGATVQTRTFQSDWLGRPVSVTEPERGATSYHYSYNSTGLQVVRTRPPANNPPNPQNTTTTTQYDSLGRVVSITYNDGTPTKTFLYDTGAQFSLSQTNLKGRLSLARLSNVNQWAGTAYSYDAMGRVLGLDECLPSGCGNGAYDRLLYYTYDWAGNQLTSTDGAGVTTSYTVSPANEVLSMTSSLSNATNPPAILTASYGPNGPYGYTLGNGLIGSYTYDTLGRLATGNVVSGSTNLYNFTATWTGSQLQTSYDSVLNQGSTYGYDEFNRLVSRTVNSGTVQNFAWTYDRWGNRTQQNLTAGSGGGQQTSYSINTATNQIVGLTYDAAGNLTNDGTHTYTYDAEGNVTAVDGGTTATYTYDALNHRVRTVVGTTATEFVFNAAGQRVSEWNGSNYTPLKGHYYWGSKPVAYYTTANAGAAATHFEHQDWMGTERARTTYNGAVEGTYTSLPYGDNSAASGTDTDANHYAMLDHDSESGTDHAQFRQYGNTQGRFMSPDPYDGSYDASNPQSFNRYTYAMNNPVSNIDPSGKDAETDEDGNEGCYLDGSYTACSTVYSYLTNGWALRCPGDSCVNVGPYGTLQHYVAFGNGSGGYYSYMGPGSIYWNLQDAGKAAALGVWPVSNSTKTEYGGAIYLDSNDVYSFTQQIGQPCDVQNESCEISIDLNVPSDTTLVGVYHTHPDIPGGENFSQVDINAMIPQPGGQFPNGLYGFLSTSPFGRVLMFNPAAFQTWVTNGTGNPVCVMRGPSSGIPTC